MGGKVEREEQSEKWTGEFTICNVYLLTSHLYAAVVSKRKQVHFLMSLS